ncbi:hypothetical protein DFN09_001282 [Clostridium acetobutylicum]|nr:hypothetical protein [Clostridium acetobutylicum]
MEKTQAFEESDFINEIDENLKEYVTLDGEGRRKKDTTGLFSTISSDIPPKNAMFSNFMSKSGFNANEMIKKSVKEEKKSIKTLNEEDAVKGAKVVHMKFGKGTIITTSRADGHINLTIAFENMGIKNLRLDMAPLQLL